jgi:hypothetical protein
MERRAAGNDGGVDEDEEQRARRDQAEIDRETAATRAAQAAFDRAGIDEALAAVETRDPEAIAAAAVELHRTHARHEAKAGHGANARRSLQRARNASLRLLRLRGGV